MPSEVVSAVIGLIGIVVGALLNHYLSKQKIEAEIEKLRAEAEQAKTESEKNKIEIVRQNKPVFTITQESFPNLETSEEYYFRAKMLATAKKYSQAISDLNQAIRLDSKNASFYITRGEIYFDLGNWRECLADETKAIEIEPNNAEYYTLRGNSYFNNKSISLAINDYQKGLELDPNRDDCYYGLALCDFEKQHFETTNYIDQAIQHAPKSEYFFLRGKIHFQLGIRFISHRSQIDDLWRAIDDFNNALSSRYSGLYLWWRGRVYYELENYPLAVSDFTSAIHAEPNDGTYYYWRGLSYKAKSSFNIKNKRLAIKDFKKAIELGNGNAQSEL